MSLERSQAFRLFRIVERRSIDIERASVAFAQKVEAAFVIGPYRVAVFSRTEGQVGMLPGRCVIQPYVARNGRRMMFSPFLTLSTGLMTYSLKSNLFPQI